MGTPTWPPFYCLGTSTWPKGKFNEYVSWQTPTSVKWLTIQESRKARLGYVILLFGHSNKGNVSGSMLHRKKLGDFSSVFNIETRTQRRNAHACPHAFKFYSFIRGYKNLSACFASLGNFLSRVSCRKVGGCS